ncbi:MAG: hypothetical protein N4J56_003356 [Chroococcidiopsis sp. SAG 2025]|nr:hypothetical protein [Chroococcidiopsis sp. SAG 2025]
MTNESLSFLETSIDMKIIRKITFLGKRSVCMKGDLFIEIKQARHSLLLEYVD